MIGKATLPAIDRFRAAPEHDGRPSVFGLRPSELRDLGPGREARGLFAGLHRVWNWNPAGPRMGRDWRSALCNFNVDPLPIVDEATSADGSVRLVLQTHDAQRLEAVWMPRATRHARATLCLSSQIGCGMGCTFCATGAMGIKRNLSAGEIVAQVHALLARCGPRHGHELNVVFMGMGEPLHNLDHVTRAIEILCHPWGLGVHPGRVTVSTSGLVPGISRLARTSPRPLLALSVNATTDAQRSAIMPVNKAYPLPALKKALLEWPLRKAERITLEYVLRKNENDQEEDAHRLAAFAEGIPHLLSLIPLNEHAHSKSQRPHDAEVLQFADWLYDAGVRAHIRWSRGRDVGAACGQLVQINRSPTSSIDAERGDATL